MQNPRINFILTIERRMFQEKKYQEVLDSLHVTLEFIFLC